MKFVKLQILESKFLLVIIDIPFIIQISLFCFKMDDLFEFQSLTKIINDETEFKEEDN